MSEAQQQKTTVNSTFTNTGHTFYDQLNEYGALKLGYNNNFAFLEIAPIFDDAKGKEAKAGDKRYNWEGSVKMFLTPELIFKLKKALEGIESGLINVATFANGKNTSVIEISRNNYDYTDIGIEEDKLSIMIVHQPNGESGDDVKYYQFVLVESEYELGRNTADEPVMVKDSYEYEYFKEWLNHALRSNMNVEFHASRWANSYLKGGVAGSAAAQSSKTVSNRPPLRRPSNKASPAASTSAASTSAAVDDIIGDDD